MNKDIALARLQWEAGNKQGAIDQLTESVRGAHILMAHYLLSMGRYEEGFKHFRYRHSREQLVTQHALRPDYAFRRYVGEQGLGDQLFFARWLDRGAVYYCHPKIARLFPEHIHAVPWNGEKLRPDTVPIADLAEKIPFPVGPAPLHPKYKALHKGHRTIGVAWETGTPPDQQRGGFGSLHKSVPLLPIANIVKPICDQVALLQRNPTADNVCALTDICQSFVDYMALNDDLDQMTTALCGLSAYVGPSSTLTHILGSLAIPCFILVPYPGDWRTQSHVSPWYPTHRHYFQDARGDWTDAFQQLHTELGAWNLD